MIPNPSAPLEPEVAPTQPEVEGAVPEMEPFNLLEDSESDAMPVIEKKKRELVIPVFDIPCPGDDDYNENQIPVAVQPPTPMNITPSEERNKFPFPAVTGGATGSVNVAMTAAEELEKKVEKQLEEAAMMLENIEEAITKSPSPTDFMMEAEDNAEGSGFEQKELEGYIKFESEPESEVFNPPPLDGAVDASESADDQLTKSYAEADEDIIADHVDLDADVDAEDSRAPLIPGFKSDHVEPFSVRLEEKLLNDFLTEYKTEIKNNLQTARVATNNLLEHQPVRRVVSDSGAYKKDRSDSYQENTETKLESLLRSSSTENKPDLFADIPMPVIPGGSWDAPQSISKIIVPENPLFSIPQMSLEEVMKEEMNEEIPITMTRSISTLIDPSNIAKEISPSLSLPDLQREYELSSLIQKMSKTPEPTLTIMTQNDPEPDLGNQSESESHMDRVGDQMDFDSSFIGKELTGQSAGT